MNNVRGGEGWGGVGAGSGGVTDEGGDLLAGEVCGLCRLAAHLYFMLPLRQMKPEPPGTRGGGHPVTLQREVLWVASH